MENEAKYYAEMVITKGWLETLKELQNYHEPHSGFMGFFSDMEENNDGKKQLMKQIMNELKILYGGNVPPMKINISDYIKEEKKRLKEEEKSHKEYRDEYAKHLCHYHAWSGMSSGRARGRKGD